jgi:AcrR family transcriptional regulator
MLMLRKGYEHMSIQDILEEVQISSGAFHHYFASRGALLEAFIERVKEASDQPLRQLIDNPTLSASEKLQGFFETLDRLRMEHQAEVVTIGRVWYSESNAVVRLRVHEVLGRQRAQLLGEIIQQGVEEGCFAVAYPDKAGEVLVALLQAMGDRHAEVLFACHQADKQLYHRIAEIVTTHAVYLDAIERVLGVPSHTFARTNAAAVQRWIEAVRVSYQSATSDESPAQGHPPVLHVPSAGK